MQSHLGQYREFTSEVSCKSLEATQLPIYLSLQESHNSRRSLSPLENHDVNETTNGDKDGEQYNYMPTTSMAEEGFLSEMMPNTAPEEFIDESVDFADMEEYLPLSGKDRDTFLKKNSPCRENRSSLIKLKSNSESQPS